METFSTLPALCEGNSMVTGGFPLSPVESPDERPVMQISAIFFVVSLDKPSNKRSRYQWFEIPSQSYHVTQIEMRWNFKLLSKSFTDMGAWTNNYISFLPRDVITHPGSNFKGWWWVGVRRNGRRITYDFWELKLRNDAWASSVKISSCLTLTTHCWCCDVI